MIPEICGANFLSSTDAQEAFQEQPADKIQLIIGDADVAKLGLYLACMAGASLLVAVGVDSKNRYVPLLTGVNKEPPSGAGLMAVTLRLLLETEQLLMIPITVFIGMEQAFFGSDFTAAFVSCAIGTGSVGFVMMSYGAIDAISSISVGYLAKITGRLPIMAAALLVQSALLVTLLTWRPQAHLSYVIYVIAVVWGLCDSVWMVEINSFYGTLFSGREQGAYANFRMWESVGFIIAYVISPGMRMRDKTYVLFGLLLVGMAGYFVVEWRAYRLKRKFKNDSVIIGVDNVAFTSN